MIRITRADQYGDMYRAYKIFIDDAYRGKIKNGETEEFEVENGSHTVRAKIDWAGSKEFCVNVNDSVVELEVGHNVRGWKHFFWFEYTTVWSGKYLYLREKGSAPEKRPLPRWLQKILGV